MREEVITDSEKLNLNADLFVKEEAYWLYKFPGKAAGSHFPYDYAGRSGARLMGNVLSGFTGELYRELMELSNENDQVLHMIFTAGLTALLWKYSFDSVGDITIGVPIYRQEFEGNFINTTLPIRFQFDGATTFKELLLQAREVIIEAVENQNYPFEKLFYKLGLTFDGDNFPLFDTVILLKNIHETKYILHTKPGMIFSFDRTGENIAGVLEYNAALYKNSSAERVFRHFRNLLIRGVSDLEIKLSGIDILSHEERNQLVYDLNNTGKDYPENKTMHRLFEEQVIDTPENIALVSEREYATYMYVNERSNQLAALLRIKGIKKNTIVGIMAEPSIEMIVGVMGVLKAGGVYLPIDFELPAERIAALVHDSSASILLTGSSIAQVFWGDIPAPEIVKIDEHITAGLVGDNLNHVVAAHDLAYIIFTSGSTGRPKGVLVDHRSATNTLFDRKREYGLDSQTVSLQLFSYAFDGFVTSFFTPVISGAKIILLNRQEISDISWIIEAIVRNRVTHFISVPALFKVIIENIKPAETTSLKVVTLAGDRITAGIMELIRAKNPDIEIAIEYGVTEASVMSTIYRRQEKDKVIKIGKPIANTRLLILDKETMLLPLGVPGELCISGVGVGQGYVNRPELTAEKFITGSGILTHHFIYRAGDLARWFDDGNIEFLGRIDAQVKVRGYRVELGEIENQLLTIDYITEAAVLLLSFDGSDPDEDKYLCAYVVASREFVKSELVEIISKKLPAYMIPSYFVRLERMPLSVTGKIDRKSLRELKVTVEKDYIAPRTETEKKLVDLWAEILDKEQNTIGRNANFFELGGHSLKAIKLVSRIHKIFNVRMRLVDIFNTQTIGRTAECIDNLSREKFISIRSAERREYYPLSSAQKRMYVVQQMNLSSVGYNQPQLIPLKFFIDKDKLEITLNKLVNRHESLRSSFEIRNDEPVQVIHINTKLKIEYHEFRDKTQDEGQHKEAVDTSLPVETLIHNFVRPFDLGKAPILRVKLVKLGKNSNILLIDMHHIICDGISIELIINDFMALYRGGRELPGLRLQYKDYAVWQNSARHQEEIKKQEEYWLNEFSGAVPVSELPLDFKRPPVQDFNGDIIYFKIEDHLRDRLIKVKERTETTLSTLLLAFFYVLLSKYSGQEDIVVGIPTSGRSHTDLENIVGMFVNVLPLRNFPRRDITFLEFLQLVKISSLNAYENQDYQFDRLVEKLGLSKVYDRNPLFNLVFSFRKDESEGKKETENKTEDSSYGLENRLSKFDLKLGAIENKHTLTMYLEYKTSLYKKETIEKIKMSYFKIMEQTLAEQNIKLEDIVIPTSVVLINSETQDDHIDFKIS